MDITKKIWISLFARQRFYKFNSRLLRRGLAGLGVDDYGPRVERGENNLMKRVMLILPKKATVCDVGAHDGVYSLFLSSRRPDLVIHAFEPNPPVFAKLASNAVGRFTAHEFALGDKEEELLLHDPKSGGGSTCASLLGTAVDELYSDQPKCTVPVQVKTLGHVAETLGLGRIDYLKIDAEGYDLMVLRGASKLIEENRLGIVQFEFNTMNIFSRSFMHDFYQALPKHRLYRIVQDGLVPLGKYNPVTCELFGFQNIVAVPEDMEAAFV